MKRTIYICLLMILLSISVSANGYDEYGGSNGSGYGSPVFNTGAASGGNFWANNVSNMVANNGGIPVPGAPANSYTYEQTKYTTVKSGTSYTVSEWASTDPNKFSEYAGISPSTGWEIWKIYPGTTTAITTQIVVTLPQANMQIMANYGPNTYFNFNTYDPSNHNYTYNTYSSSSTGPVLVGSAPQPPITVVSYDDIPRVPFAGGTVDMGPGSDFITATQLYNKPAVSLPEAFKIIRDYIDRVIPDATNGRSTYIENVIGKVANSLPDDLKDAAESIVIMYMQLNNSNISTEDMIKIYNDPNPIDIYPDWNPTLPLKVYTPGNDNPNVSGPDMVFDRNGKLVTGTSIQNTITNSTKILIKGVYYSPTQLNTSRGNRFLMIKIASYYAQKMGVDPGTIITSGKKPDQNSTDNPAFTNGLVISLNINGGFSKWFNNISSFRSIIKHENFHKEDNEIPGFVSTLQTHAAVYIKQVKDVSFATVPADFKLGIALAFGNYLLNMDKNSNFTSSEVITKITEFNTNPFALVMIRPATFIKGNLTLDLKNMQTNITYPVPYELINE